MWKQEYSNMFELEDEYWWYRGLHDLIERYVRFEARTSRPNIIDAGCGSGKLMSIMSRYGDVTGFDMSEDAIHFSRERGHENVTIQDINDWKPPSDTYDIATCIDVLCHEAVPDVDAILRKFHSCLKHKGILILNLPSFDVLARHHDVVVRTVRRCRKRPFGRQLRNVGFEVRVSSYRLPFLFSSILLMKFFSKFTSPKEPESDLKALPTMVNSLLTYRNYLENVFIYHGIPMPFGSSLFVVARKR
jgi:SAM-dependent methyltransferase